MHYVLYQNAEAVKIDDGKEGSVMFVKFAVQKTTHISFDMEILLSVDTTEGKDTGNVSEGDAYVKATFENFIKRFDNLGDMRAVLDRQNNLSNE